MVKKSSKKEAGNELTDSDIKKLFVMNGIDNADASYGAEVALITCNFTLGLCKRIIESLPPEENIKLCKEYDQMYKVFVKELKELKNIRNCNIKEMKKLKTD